MAKKNTKKTKKRLSSAEISQRNEQRNQKKEICDILKNIGFEKLSYIDGKEFNYEGRTSELDDIFIFENVILLTEYTIGDPHLLKKSIFYDRVNSDKKAFINFMLQEEKLSSFKKYYQDNIKDKYSINQLRVKILYCSKKSISEEKSSFKEGYKIVSFYIDAESLIKRAYVLRQEGWREKENIGYYQRMFEAKKISSMRKYLTENSRVFINNIISTIAENQIKLFDRKGNPIIINDKGEFEGDNASTNVTPALIEINDECNIIGLIDGQHRTYAYHEGDDIYEPHIAKLRKIQNLLVTGILFPQKESKESRLKFEANLFLEINLNQTKVKPKLQQEIELMITPFSNIAIGKRILKGLNSNGPLSNLIEQYSFEKGKIKTASIVSFGLKPLIKLDDIKSKDSLYSLWENQDKARLKERKSEEYQILNEYISFCITKIRDLLIAFKSELSSDKWETYTPQNPNGMLNVTFINGVLNVLRLLIENNKISDIQNYKEKLKDIDKFDFKKYKSSQYRKMGKDIYAKYFENAI